MSGQLLATLARIEEVLHEELVDIKNHMYALGTQVQALEAKLDAALGELSLPVPIPKHGQGADPLQRHQER